MKIVLFIGVLIASVLGQAENRCSVQFTPSGYIIHNSTQGHYGTLNASNYSDAIAILQKMNDVSACSPHTANCFINSSGSIYYLFNKVESYGNFMPAYNTSRFDDIISAFDQLVKAGGCQP